MKITEALHDDHEEVLDLLSRVERGVVEPTAEVVSTIVRELSVHAAAEETTVYPAVAQLVPAGESLTEEHVKEHQLVKDLLAQLERAPEGERLPLLAAIAAYVRHHVEHEETKLFPKLRDYADDEVLERIGEAFQNAKKTAPTHPHPHGPRRPPANTIANRMAALLDRVRDSVGAGR